MTLTEVIDMLEGHGNAHVCTLGPAECKAMADSLKAMKVLEPSDSRLIEALASIALPAVSESPDSFYDGCVVAMGVLREQLEERIDGMRNLVTDQDVGLVLNGVRNVLSSVRSRFEAELSQRALLAHRGEAKKCLAAPPKPS